MKKITLLVAALCATMMASAAVITVTDFTSVDLVAANGGTGTDWTAEVSGITLSSNGAIADATYNGVTNRTLRVFAGQTLTISCAQTISKIEIIGMAKKGANITANPGTVVGGDYSSAEADVYNNETFDTPLFVVNDVNATSTVITPVKQIRVYGIRVTTTGEGGEQPGEGGEEEGGEEEGELDYTYEPTEVTTLNLNLSKGDYVQQTGYIDMFFTGEEADLELIFMVNEVVAQTIVPAGTYEINNTEAENTVLASPGGDDIYDYPSVVYTQYDEEGYYNAAYYLMSGTVTVSAEGEGVRIVVAATSYNGSTINATYSGVVEEYETAIEKVEIDNSVYAHDGRIYAEEGARIFNLVGLDVTEMNGNLNGVFVVRNGNKVAKVLVTK